MGSAGMALLASIATNNLKAEKGEHNNFDWNDDVEDKSVDDRIEIFHQGETEQQQGKIKIKIKKEKAKNL